MSEGADHEDPLYLNALPSTSTAAQKLALGHDTDSRSPLASMCEGADHVGPPLAAVTCTDTSTRLSRATLASTRTNVRKGRVISSSLRRTKVALVKEVTR
jgi:hypothetical protein